MRRPTMFHLAVVMSAASLALGTGAARASTPSTSDQKTANVKVRLQEFTVKTDPSSVPAGPVDFKVKNKGSVTHEMVVVKTDGAPLPIKADGSVDEDQIPKRIRLARSRTSSRVTPRPSTPIRSNLGATPCSATWSKLTAPP